MTFKKSFLSLALATVIGFTSFAQAETTAPSKLPFNEDQRAAMEDFVRNFILDNPEVLMESVNRYRANEDQKKEETSKKVLEDSKDFLAAGKHPEIGNPKADVVVVEFFDYNCGYCKRALNVMQELSQKDKDVRIVFMDLPILSPQSAVAAKWAVAANMQGKYWAFHQAVLESSAPRDEDNLTKIAKSVGLNVDKLKVDAEGKKVEDYLASVKDFSQKLNISGTPAFLINQEIVRGFIEYPAFETIVKSQREAKK